MARTDLAGRLDQHEWHAAAGPLLVARDECQDLLYRSALERERQAAGGEELRHLATERVASGEAQRGEQTDSHSLSVPVARVPGGGLDRVADGVPQVER